MEIADILTKVALESSQYRLPHLVGIGEHEDISIFRHEGVNYVYKLVWMIEGPDIVFWLEVRQVTAGPRGGKPKTEVVVSRQFTEKVEA